jgi:hypothetical protein
MCHPQADGTEFYSIQTSWWGFIWTPLGSNDEADQFTLATYPTKWEAMHVAQRLHGEQGMEPYAVAYYPAVGKGPS